MNAFDIRTQMQHLQTYLEEADAKVREGKAVDLTSLDKKVTQICQQATRLPRAQALEIQPLMASLIGTLERLTLSLQDYRDNIGR